MPLSIVILTKNESHHLQNCLNSITGLAEEIIIIDDYSTDQTREIAKRFHCRVFTHSLQNNFAQQRNFGLKKAQADWILFLDADEKVTIKLKKEIKTLINQPNNPFHGYQLKRLDYFLGRPLRFGETGQTKLSRLARRQVGYWSRPVHEIWLIKGQVGELTNPLLHLSHPNLTAFLSSIDFYTEIEAQYRRQLKPSPLRTLIELIFFPPLKFIYNYGFKLGFLDGFPGLIMAYFMSLHSLIVRVKLLTS